MAGAPTGQDVGAARSPAEHLWKSCGEKREKEKGGGGAWGRMEEEHLVGARARDGRNIYREEKTAERRGMGGRSA
jgi:hypothetical protein